MDIIIKNTEFKDKYLSLFNKVFKRVDCLLDTYGLLDDGDSENSIIKELNFNDVSIEVVFDHTACGEISKYDDSDNDRVIDILEGYLNRQNNSSSNYSTIKELCDEIIKNEFDSADKLLADIEYSDSDEGTRMVCKILLHYLRRKNMNLSSFKELSDNRFIITLYDQRINMFNDSDKLLQVSLAHELFKVFNSLSYYQLNSLTSVDPKATEALANIFEMLYADFIGYEEYMPDKFYEIGHLAERNNLC